MTILNSKKILEENNAREPNSILSLSLTHKAISDVSCLGEFKNLERLDLALNNLNSVESLKACVNLKWLSVVQNKLQSLEGIQGLTKLTVLNAGKNKLKSMDDVRSLVSLRALILNDNEITSLCNLHQMKELNTLVLSRNPVSEIGNSLIKIKSITKLSLSNCQLQTIGSSLTSCTQLKELRLAHNDIKTLPVELSRNAKLQNVDLGNNLITNLSDLKVLSSLVNLRSLNLQGNPIAEKDTLVNKIKKLVPNLQIFNTRPTDKIMKKEGQRTDGSITDGDKPVDQNKLQGNLATGKKNSKKYLLSARADDDDRLGTARDGVIEESNNKRRKGNELKEQPSNAKENHDEEDKRKKKLKLEVENDDIADDSKFPFVDTRVGKDSKHKKQKKEKPSMDTPSALQEESNIPRKGDRKSKKKLKQEAGVVIDDGEAPSTELFVTEAAETTNRGKEMDTRSIPDTSSAGGIVTIPAKNKKNKNRSIRASIADLAPTDEVGLGGPSTWDD